jgi:hypothetical protein
MQETHMLDRISEIERTCCRTWMKERLRVKEIMKKYL